MEKLKERLALAERAVSKLEELASMDEWTEVERDAMIQRFEFSYEILWKCAKDYLRVFEGIDAASPRRVIRECQRIGILSAEQTEMALRMSGDRNLTTHTYDEEFAVELSARMKDYGKLLRNWLEKIRFDRKKLKKIPVKSYAIMFSNDRHSPNRDFVFPILFDDSGNW